MRLLLLSSPGADLLPGLLSPPPDEGDPLDESDAPGGPGDLPRSPPLKLDNGDADEEFLRRSSIAANGGFSSLDSGRCGRPGGPPGALLGAPGRCNDARCASGFGAPGGKDPAIEPNAPGGALLTGGSPGCPAKDKSPLAIDAGGIPGSPAKPGGKPGVPGGAIPGGNPGIPGIPGIPPLAACCFFIKRNMKIYRCHIEGKFK